MDTDCFGCGSDNPHGLGMRFSHKDGVLRSRLKVPGHLCGWGSLVHGGILSTILDEVMSWTAIHLLSSYILTRDMSVRYRRPVSVRSPLTAYGWIKESGRGRKAVIAAEIRDGEDRVCTEAEGTYALFTAEQFERLGL
jgi:uncharacterized protein (TIGR00369 family)